MARLAIIAKAMTPRIFQDRFIVYEPAKNPATNCGKEIMNATTDADIQRTIVLNLLGRQLHRFARWA